MLAGVRWVALCMHQILGDVCCQYHTWTVTWTCCVRVGITANGIYMSAPSADTAETCVHMHIYTCTLLPLKADIKMDRAYERHWVVSYSAFLCRHFSHISLEKDNHVLASKTSCMPWFSVLLCESNSRTRDPRKMAFPVFMCISGRRSWWGICLECMIPCRAALQSWLAFSCPLAWKHLNDADILSIMGS